jgi:hypothetical protein
LLKNLSFEKNFKNLPVFETGEIFWVVLKNGGLFENMRECLNCLKKEVKFRIA